MKPIYLAPVRTTSVPERFPMYLLNSFELFSIHKVVHLLSFLIITRFKLLVKLLLEFYLFDTIAPSLFNICNFFFTPPLLYPPISPSLLTTL